MRRLMSSLRRKEEGQALVELAFVVPLLLLFLFGIIDFALALNQYNSDTNVANLAARTVSVFGSQSGPSLVCGGTAQTTLVSWVDCEAKSTGAPVPTAVCIADESQSPASASASTFTVGDAIKVGLTSSFSWFGILSGGDSYIGKVVSPNTSITASATMRLEVAPNSSNSAFFSGTPLCST